MSVEEVMKEHGFNLAASCAGKAAFTKWIKYKGKRAYISVHDVTGESFPTTLEEAVRVAVHDLRSGNEVEPGREIGSLKSYLATLQE
jgi:hypothetical protein